MMMSSCRILFATLTRGRIDRSPIFRIVYNCECFLPGYCNVHKAYHLIPFILNIQVWPAVHNIVIGYGSVDSDLPYSIPVVMFPRALYSLGHGTLRLFITAFTYLCTKFGAFVTKCTMVPHYFGKTGWVKVLCHSPPDIIIRTTTTNTNDHNMKLLKWKCTGCWKDPNHKCVIFLCFPILSVLVPLPYSMVLTSASTKWMITTGKLNIEL